MLYQQGTSVVSGKTRSNGIGISAGGLGFGSSSGAFAGVQQTAVGAMASPPDKKQIFPRSLGQLFLWMIAGIGLFIAYKNHKYNKEVWPKLYEEWQSMFYCNQCGSSFQYMPTNTLINVTPQPIEIEGGQAVR